VPHSQKPAGQSELVEIVGRVGTALCQGPKEDDSSAACKPAASSGPRITAKESGNNGRHGYI